MFRVNSLEGYLLRLPWNLLRYRKEVVLILLSWCYYRWIGSSSVSKHKIKVNNKYDILRASCVQSSWSSFNIHSSAFIVDFKRCFACWNLDRLQQRPSSKNQCGFIISWNYSPFSAMLVFHQWKNKLIQCVSTDIIFFIF